MGWTRATLIELVPSVFERSVATMTAESGGDDVPDLVPPSQVANLVANPTVTPSVELSWDAATDNVSVSGYQIERRIHYVPPNTTEYKNDSYGGICSYGLTTRTISTTTSGTSRDFGFVGNGNCYAIQSIGAVSGTAPSLSGKIQESNDATIWTDIVGATFTAVTTPNNIQSIEFLRTKRYIRYVAGVSGITPSFGISVIIGKEPEAFEVIESNCISLTYEDTTVEEYVPYEYRVTAFDPTLNYGDYSNSVFALAHSELQINWYAYFSPTLLSATVEIPSDLTRPAAIAKLQRKVGAAAWASTPIENTLSFQFPDPIQLTDDPENYVVPEAPLDPEETYKYRVVLEIFGINGPPSNILTRYSELITSVTSGTKNTPANTEFLQVTAIGKGSDGSIAQGGTSGEFAISHYGNGTPGTLESSFDYTIATEYAEVTHTISGQTVYVTHGGETPSQGAVGNIITAGMNVGEATIDDDGGGGGSGTNYDAAFDPPSGMIGGISYKWPGGNGGNGGLNGANGTNATNYGAGGGGSTAGIQGTGGSALLAFTWLVNADVAL